MTHILEALETIEIPVDPAMKKSFEQQQDTSMTKNTLGIYCSRSDYDDQILVKLLSQMRNIYLVMLCFQSRLKSLQYVLFRNVSID